MTLLEIKNIYQEKLDHLYGTDESRHIFLMTSAHHDGWTRLDIALNPNLELSSVQRERYLNWLSELEKGKPIQYLLGHVNFLDLKLEVDEQVLIPRPETEELVLWIAESHQEKPQKILDIGTGSGCIALALKQRLKASTITAIDKSEAALKLARSNAHRLQLDVNFGKYDILSSFPDLTFDVIVSNPPYVRESEKEHMNDNVLCYEPKQALFVSDKDPLLFYRTISKKARQSLNPGGSLYFEINEAFGKETKILMEQHGFSQIELKKDLFGKDRMIKGVKN